MVSLCNDLTISDLSFLADGYRNSLEAKALVRRKHSSAAIVLQPLETRSIPLGGVAEPHEIEVIVTKQVVTWEFLWKI